MFTVRVSILGDRAHATATRKRSDADAPRIPLCYAENRMYPQVFGKYVLEREISRGGMARVLLATLRGAGGFEKRLVVKQIRDELATDSEFVRRFVEEAKMAVALSHPNIVPVYELGVEGGTYFIAMELVEGVSVADLLKRGKTVSPEEGAYIGAEVCRALDYAHRRMRVVHRDVTPRNVMIDEEGQVKVIDFGIAAPAQVAGHEVFGSPGHMPPEQVDGHKLGPPCDVFAVAVLLMEAWSGAAPFRRATPADCLEAMRAKHPRPSDTDARLIPLDEVIGQAMDLDPSKRPQHAEDLARALRKFLQEVDEADIARQLGERVRAIHTRPRLKRGSTAPESFRPPMMSIGDALTKTFAAREEVDRWKSEAPPPATRPLPKSDPRIEAEPRVETVATKPLETPVQPPRTGLRGRPGVSGVSPDRKIAGAGALLGILSAALFFATRHGVSPPVPVVPATTTASPTAARDRTTTPTPSSTSTSTAAPNLGLSPSSPALSAAPPSAKAHLALLGDPGTRVSVDGAPRGACPLRDLALDPGTHDILFTFDPTGERRGDRVELKAGEHVRMRADFAGAQPQIRIER
jgi:serine/threonine-protein kinase